MTITDVRIRPVGSGNLIAAVSVTFDNEFVVHDIKIVQTQKGIIVCMPSRKTVDGEFKDICHPINQAFRDTIVTAVMEKYESQSVVE